MALISQLYISGRHGGKIFHALKPIVPFERLLCPKYQQKMVQSINVREPNGRVKVTADQFINCLPSMDLLHKHTSYINELDKVYEEKHAAFTKKRKSSPSAKDIESDAQELTAMRDGIKAIRLEIYELEDAVIPVLKHLPNILDAETDDAEDKILRRSKRRHNEQKSFKQLDFVKLCYINSGFYSSPISPDGVYLMGKMALLHDALIRKAEEMVKDNNYVDFSGLDFVKSGVVEATIDENERNVFNDPLTISKGYETTDGNQLVHLVGDSSLSSFAAFASRILKYDPKDATKDKSEAIVLKYFSSGTSYHVDNESNQTIQSNNVRSYLLIKKPKDNLIKESMEAELNLIWNFYQSLDVPCQAIQVKGSSLNNHESSRIDVQCYQRSKSDWITVASVINYGHYLTDKLGIRDAHLISCLLVDAKPLVAAIVESNQQVDGSFAVPEVLGV